MWFMLILWKSFRGLWRLVVGLIIGVVLYIYTFTTPGLEWIFNDVYAFSNAIIVWVSQQSWYPEYEKWDHLVKPGDRLPLILYILVGRFIWLMFEAILFTFPHWLFIGRNKQKKTANSPELAPIAPERRARASDIASGRGGSSVKDGMAPVMGHSGIDKASLQQVAAPAAAIAASALAREERADAPQSAEAPLSADAPLSNGHVQPGESSENLERSIDEALQRIKKVGEQNSNN